MYKLAVLDETNQQTIITEDELSVGAPMTLRVPSLGATSRATWKHFYDDIIGTSEFFVRSEEQRQNFPKTPRTGAESSFAVIMRLACAVQLLLLQLLLLLLFLLFLLASTSIDSSSVAEDHFVFHFVFN